MLEAVAERAARDHLEIFGGFHPRSDDALPDHVGTLLMFGPREPGFWAHVTGEPEFGNGNPDAVDRWSERVVGGIAREFGGVAYFPFGGPPWRPFIAWAKATGRAWTSAVGILVHDTAGLMVSYRGAIGLEERLALPPTGRRPCDTCDEMPCLGACPVGALNDKGYDIPACKAYLGSSAGQECMGNGCAVRRACPVSKGYGRLPAQSAYHMGYFRG
jgi:epoxyqueuosine reductase